MPYYVYALHADSRLNCDYGSFLDYQEAEICQREKCGLPGSQDNFFVRLFYARNKAHAAQVLKKIRGEMGLK